MPEIRTEPGAARAASTAALPLWHPERSRQIRRRIVVQGLLVLQTPAALGNGDAHEQVDMPLMRDERAGLPLLTGTSLAGGLRAYLASFDMNAAELLFGGKSGDDLGEQSPLLVDDALGLAGEGALEPLMNRRDGVRLSGASRTAADQALYDREVWVAGGAFHLRFELLIAGDSDEQKLRNLLATALHGLETEQVPIGARKTRGYGQAKVERWQVDDYDLTDPAHIAAYVAEADAPTRATGLTEACLQATLITDTRDRFTIQAMFALDGPLLIRTAGRQRAAPDVVHLSARQADGTRQPVLSGTTLAGALRSRARAIAHVSGKNAQSWTDKIFGPVGERRGVNLHASRLRTSEQAVKSGVSDLVQSRVSIDRFTGGARDGLLFDEQPVFPRAENQTTVTLNLTLVNPYPGEIGLTLLLLKDLWLRDLPVGGGASNGRGRLRGLNAHLRRTSANGSSEWNIESDENGALRLDDADARAALEGYVTEWVNAPATREITNAA